MEKLGVPHINTNPSNVGMLVEQVDWYSARFEAEHTLIQKPYPDAPVFNQEPDKWWMVGCRVCDGESHLTLKKESDMPYVCKARIQRLHSLGY